MSVVVRPRTEEDISALAKVLLRVHEKDGYPVEGMANPQAWLRSDRMLGAWVAELDLEVVGQVIVTEPGADDESANMLSQRDGLQNKDIAVLGRLFVDPAARGQRLAGQLIGVAVDAARGMNRQLVLDVMKKDQAAIKTYQRLGWLPLGAFGHKFSGGEEPALAFYLPVS